MKRFYTKLLEGEGTTFCTRFCENEHNIKLIQDIMGHADISTTININEKETECGLLFQILRL